VSVPRIAGVLAALPALASLASLACGRVDTSVGAQNGGAPAPDAVAPPDGATAPDASLATSVYMEAESGKLSGFTIESDPTASGGEYILPPNVQTSTTPGAATAEYAFAIGRTGPYILWGRLHAPGAENNAFFVTMDDGPTVRWQLSTGVVWFWGAVTDHAEYANPVEYMLDAGTHKLVFRNALPLVGLDRLYVTVPGDMPPGNDTPCNPPHSIELADGGCIPSCGSHGATTCGDQACAGQALLVSYDCTVCCIAPDGGAQADGGLDGGPDGAPDEGPGDAPADRDDSNATVTPVDGGAG
jgi:hypothetical protein